MYVEGGRRIISCYSSGAASGVAEDTVMEVEAAAPEEAAPATEKTQYNWSKLKVPARSRISLFYHASLVDTRWDFFS
jgi:hypothetical protein